MYQVILIVQLRCQMTVKDLEMEELNKGFWWFDIK